jgi:hypothetical protein
MGHHSKHQWRGHDRLLAQQPAWLWLVGCLAMPSDMGASHRQPQQNRQARQGLCRHSAIALFTTSSCHHSLPNDTINALFIGH